EAGAQAHPGQVVMDRTAQGFGWFIDAGTAGTAGFTAQLAPTEFHATPGSSANGRFDLLTVVAHELGHVVGLPDILDESNHPGTRVASTALSSIPASLQETSGLHPPADRVAVLLTGQTQFVFPGQVETGRTAAERTSLLFARAELRPAFAEWGNELCNCLNA